MRHATTLVTALIILIFPWTCAHAEVSHAPVRPTHEDNVVVHYEPAPGDNTTKVVLKYSIDGTTMEDMSMAPDTSTGDFSIELGVLPAGAEVAYRVMAWNRTVGEGNISVAAMVEMLWHRDMEEALSKALELERPLMIFLFSDNDKDGYRMDMETFTDERVLNLSAQFVVVRVNMDLDPFTANRYDVKETPSTIFLDNTTKEVHRFVGFRSADSFVGHMEFSLGTGPRPDEGKEPQYPGVTHYLILMILSLLIVVGVIYILVRMYMRRL